MLDIPIERSGSESFERTWSNGRGLLAWLSVTTHHAIGKRYIITAFIFLFIAGLEALVMRLQLATPENTLVHPDIYDRLFTVHGTTMMFLFAVPMMEGMAVYLIPTMIGTRNVAFP